jgi:hypothetical protein
VNLTNVKPLLAILLLAAISNRGDADDCCCCAQCGCQSSCRKICRLVCEGKKVDVPCWGCKCEDFCVPCRSTPGCCHCECVCDECKPCDPSKPYAEPKRFFWLDWLPGGAKMYTRTKLMRKTEHVTVPSYKWVVEDLCAECAAKVKQPEGIDVAQLPPMPILPASATTR